ncbi:hypothetical protein [Methanoculleus bourgensis]|nr:hypothetical protein [Methanoculleus bourgensis]
MTEKTLDDAAVGRARETDDIMVAAFRPAPPFTFTPSTVPH